jgi:hypothetical protein
MIDSHETSSVQEERTIETQAAEVKPLQTKAEVIEYLKELANDPANVGRQELDRAKQTFYKLHNAEQAQLKQQFEEQGGDPEAFVPAADPDEETFKEVMNAIKEKRAALYAEAEKEKQENLEKKQAIIDEIQQLCTTPDETNKHFDRFKELQQQWKEIGVIPAEKISEIWKTYQHEVEQFYDLLKLNHELREYDFKKNLEQKEALCEKAEKLADREDVLEAFRELQKLHEEFREIGPVAKELREKVWIRFKAATTIINKKHQQYYDDIKAKEESNLQEKTALCEAIEELNSEKPENMQAWNDVTQKVLELQNQWKKIGFAPQKMNTKIFERFRAACDTFFEAKAAYFKEVRGQYAENLAMKEALCEKVEALKDSTDWKGTAEAIAKLKEEWRAVGPVARKQSDLVWKRFISACDAFFDNRKKVQGGQHSEERENLKKKRSIIEQLQQLVDEKAEDIQAKVKELQNEWNETGHVPFKEKDALYEAYHELTDKIYGALNMNRKNRRMNNFKNSVKNASEAGGNTLAGERNRLQKAYEKLAAEVKTYENNLNFLTSNSKKGNSLVDQMVKKMEKLKEELALLRQKIQTIDEEIRKENQD